MTASRAGFTSLIAALLALTGCPSAMSTVGSSDSSNERFDTDVVEWPVRFKAHMFGAYCFSTYDCRVMYAGMLRTDDPEGELQPPSEAIADKYPQILRGGMGPIGNFPPPAKVSWRAKDGTPLEASVDLDEIFKDRVIRHNLKREEISERGIGPGALPEIILEVNDRTINVYMRAHISTRELQQPGNRYSDFRADMIKVFSRTY